MPRICVGPYYLFCVWLRWWNANSLKQNIIVITFFLAATLVGWIGGEFVYRKVSAKNIFLSFSFLPLRICKSGAIRHSRDHGWKVGGDLTWYGGQSPSSTPPSLPRLPLSLHPCFAHSLPYSSFFLPLNLAKRSVKALSFPHCPEEKRQPVAKVGWDQIHSVPIISKVGGDASHGSHRLVAPTLYDCLKLAFSAVRKVTTSRFTAKLHAPHRNNSFIHKHEDTKTI